MSEDQKVEFNGDGSRKIAEGVPFSLRKCRGLKQSLESGRCGLQVNCGQQIALVGHRGGVGASDHKLRLVIEVARPGPTVLTGSRPCCVGVPVRNWGLEGDKSTNSS